MTIFDVATVTCFVIMVIAYLLLTNRSTRILLALILSGIAFAVADQLGNAGYMLLASILTVGGGGYAFVVMRG